MHHCLAKQPGSGETCCETLAMLSEPISQEQPGGLFILFYLDKALCWSRWRLCITFSLPCSVIMRLLVTDYIVNGAGYPVGTPLTDPALIEMISEDPVLRGTKLIAEAWDCDGLNQVGAFPHYGGRWAEWNGHFRDSVRQFVKVSLKSFHLSNNRCLYQVQTRRMCPYVRGKICR